jgi:uncharacterized protein (UPF0333 family)
MSSSFKKTVEKQAQASIEYLMLVGVSLLIIALLAGYSFMVYSQTASNHEIQSTAKELRNAINSVYSLGEGNSVVVQITLPQNISNVTIGNNYLIFETVDLGQKSSSLEEFDANLSGSIPSVWGVYQIQVKNIGGVVNLNAFE